LSELFHVSAAPHARSPITTKHIMRDVVIALMPASLFGIYNFGLNALLILLTTVTVCLLTEYIYCKAMKKPITTSDFSAVVTGLLLAFNLPVGLPLWMAVLGGIFAIVVVKMVFGGLGQNFMNPALAARAFLLISFSDDMADFAVKQIISPKVTDYILHGAIVTDGVSGATPLQMLKAGESVNLFNTLIGSVGGSIGETSALAIILGGLYLIFRKVISFRIPVIYILTVAVFLLLFSGEGADMNYLMGQILGGGLLLGAFFMATDYVTSPATPKGQILYALLLGILTGIFRVFGKSAEGVSYAILLGNILVPLIEKVTIPAPFGKERVASEK
jgi:Na+-translocating ferredoxin:NAD+ oxidoreductase subunit D